MSHPSHPAWRTVPANTVAQVVTHMCTADGASATGGGVGRGHAATRSGIDAAGVRGQVQAERRMKARSSTSSPMDRP
jgi:hypothetical protein